MFVHRTFEEGLLWPERAAFMVVACLLSGRDLQLRRSCRAGLLMHGWHAEFLYGFVSWLAAFMKGPEC